MCYESSQLEQMSTIIVLTVQGEFEHTKGVIRISNRRMTTQWPKEKVQKDKQRSTKHTYKTRDRVTRTPHKTGVNSGAPEWLAVPSQLVAP